MEDVPNAEIEDARVNITIGEDGIARDENGEEINGFGEFRNTANKDDIQETLLEPLIGFILHKEENYKKVKKYATFNDDDVIQASAEDQLHFLRKLYQTGLLRIVKK